MSVPTYRVIALDLLLVRPLRMEVGKGHHLEPPSVVTDIAEAAKLER